MKKSRAFLKWAGGKYALVDQICQHLPEGTRMVEPFVGAGSVFLNTNYEHYLLNDINSDLIAIYHILQRDHQSYIQDAREFFQPSYNDKQRYYEIRAAFNSSSDAYERSLMFLYMNRHGFNGLCRYNQKGGFNVPFGSYKRPYFPEAELEFFAEKSQKAIFTNQSYQDVFRHIQNGDVIYCDPPYAPLSNTANFTNYSTNGFSLDDQAQLAICAEQVTATCDARVLISNHDTTLTRQLYHQAQLSTLQVKRTISRNGQQRNKVDELFALYRTQLSSSLEL